MRHIWPEVSAFVLFVFLYIGIVLLAGCSCDGGLRNMSDEYCDKPAAANGTAPMEHPEWSSWDQANLKRNDHGCPTAIYAAPNGVLEQCP